MSEAVLTLGLKPDAGQNYPACFVNDLAQTVMSDVLAYSGALCTIVLLNEKLTNANRD